VPAVVLFAVDRPPDVLISDTTQAVAVRFADGLALVDGKAGSFAVRVWEETYGGTIGQAKPDDPVRCDGIGCIATPGYTLALIEDPAGFYEDCASADVVITRRRAPKGCAAPVVIDADALARGGVHWLRWDGHRFEVRTAIPDPERAWRIAR
jgi:competence protein ComEC